MVAQEFRHWSREGSTFDALPLKLTQRTKAVFVGSEVFKWTSSSTILLHELSVPQFKDITSSPLAVPIIPVYDTSLIATALVPVFNILRQ